MERKKDLCVALQRKVCKPDSVEDNHFSCRIVADTVSAKRMRLSPTNRSAALHSGKDLAVSPSHRCENPPSNDGVHRLAAMRVSVRTSWIAPCGRYPLPLPTKSRRSVRTFLPEKILLRDSLRGDYPTFPCNEPHSIHLYNKYNAMSTVKRSFYATIIRAIDKDSKSPQTISGRTRMHPLLLQSGKYRLHRLIHLSSG